MAATGLRKRLALDTNLLLDLAEERDWAHEFRERFQSRGYTLLAGPTVFQELAFASLYEAQPKRGLAQKATVQARGLGIGAFDLSSLHRGIAERFAESLLWQSVLPA